MISTIPLRNLAPDENCCMCLGLYDDANPPYKHSTHSNTFCKKCIIQWAETKMSVTPPCPICREPLDILTVLTRMEKVMTILKTSLDTLKMISTACYNTLTPRRVAVGIPLGLIMVPFNERIEMDLQNLPLISRYVLGGIVGAVASTSGQALTLFLMRRNIDPRKYVGVFLSASLTCSAVTLLRRFRTWVEHI